MHACIYEPWKSKCFSILSALTGIRPSLKWAKLFFSSVSKTFCGTTMNRGRLTGNRESAQFYWQNRDKWSDRSNGGWEFFVFKMPTSLTFQITGLCCTSRALLSVFSRSPAYFERQHLSHALFSRNCEQIYPHIIEKNCHWLNIIWHSIWCF